MDYSFGLLKPDCLKRGLEKQVLAEIEAAGLNIIAQKRIRLTKHGVALIWPTCRFAPFYEKMVEFSLSGDCLVFIVRGKDAINRLNSLVGYHEPSQAGKDTIRYRFGTSSMENIIHSAQDEERFRKEASLFFSEAETYLDDQEEL